MSSIMRRRRGLISPIGSLLSEGVGLDHPHPLRQEAPSSPFSTSYRDSGFVQPLFHHALDIFERRLGAQHPQVIPPLSNLAELYLRRGATRRAESLLKRAHAVAEAAYGSDHPEVAAVLNNLGSVQREGGRLPEARAAFKLASTILTAALGPDHPDVATTLNNLAAVEASAENTTVAADLYRRSLAVQEAVYGPDHPELVDTLNNLAELEWLTGRPETARRRLERPLRIVRSRAPEGDPEVAELLANLAVLLRTQGRVLEAVAAAREATTIYRANAQRFGGHFSAVRRDLLARWGGHFLFHLELLTRPAPGLNSSDGETFELAQLVKLTDTAEVIARMAARFAAGSGELRALVRKQQDAVNRWRAVMGQLVDTLGEFPAAYAPSRVARLRADRQRLERQLTELQSEIEGEDPRYAQLVDLHPLPLGDAQRLLGEHEGLIVFVVDDVRSYAWAVPRDRSEMRTLEIGREALEEAVSHLRLGLDPAGGRGVRRLQDSIERLRGGERPGDGRSVVAGFDLDLAYGLYEKIWVPFEPLLEGVKHVLVVPDGPLESLPLQVLVAAAPTKELAGAEDLRG